MPTAILDLEYDDLPEAVGGLERYAQARVLVRLAGHPAAWVHVPVEQGQVTSRAVVDAVQAQAGPTFWQMLAKCRLEIAEPSATGLPAASELPSATVAICTRDRADDLRRCLEGVRRMPDDGQEVLVVDSASKSPDTRVVAESFAGVRYVQVERRGLNIARNAAMQAAKGEIVVFIDDDAVPDVHWLHEHRKAFGSPLTMASMGLTLPLELEVEAQEKFEAYSPFSRGFQPRTFQCLEMNPLAAGHAGAGVNMALRREAVQLVGPFDEALDSGTPTHSGGESEFLARLLAYHYRIKYTPAALNWHRHRRSMAELRRTIFGYGAGVYAFWTARFLADREWGSVYLGAEWFRLDQAPRFVNSVLRRPGAPPWPLPWDELRGCVVGPWAYLRARRQAKKSGA